MNPDIWGPKFWFSLHSVTFDYPFRPDISEKIRIRDFFNSLEYILPCKICRVNYSKHIREIPIENNLGSRKKLVYWLIDIHNRVNAINNKPLLSYDEVISIYEQIYRKNIILEENDEDQNIIPNNKDNKGKICINSNNQNNNKELTNNTNNKRFIIGISLTSFFLLFAIILLIYLLLIKKKK